MLLLLLLGRGDADEGPSPQASSPGDSFVSAAASSGVLYVCRYVCLSVCMCMHMYMYMYMCMYMYVYMVMCVYIYIYIERERERDMYT